MLAARAGCDTRTAANALRGARVLRSIYTALGSAARELAVFAPPPGAVDRADLVNLDAMHRMFPAMLLLTADDRDAVTQRGLTLDAITTGMYRTMPERVVLHSHGAASTASGSTSRNARRAWSGEPHPMTLPAARGRSWVPRVSWRPRVTSKSAS
jgi:hypothetical protein